jgi:hypothetical protein
MSGNHWIMAAILGGAMAAAGCEKESETTPGGAPAPVPQASEQAADDAKSKVDDAAGAAKSDAERMGEAAQKQIGQSADAIKKGADAAAEAAATNPAVADAQTKLNQVTQYIKEKKFDLAEAAMKQLEANKASLPAVVQSQLANTRTMLDTAKKAASATAPSLPALPK